MGSTRLTKTIDTLLEKIEYIQVNMQLISDRSRHHVVSTLSTDELLLSN